MTLVTSTCPACRAILTLTRAEAASLRAWCLAHDDWTAAVWLALREARL